MTMEQLEKWARAHPARFRGGIDSWRDGVESRARELGYVEKGGGRRMLWAAVAAGLAAAVVWVMFVLSQEWWLLALVAVCVVAAFASPVMKRRSREAAELYERYRALYRYLRDFGRLDEKPPAAAVLWERYLVMAVVFGIATQVIEQMHVTVPEVAADPAFTSVFWFTTPAFASTAGGVGPALSSFTGGVSAAVAASSPPVLRKRRRRVLLVRRQRLLRRRRGRRRRRWRRRRLAPGQPEIAVHHVAPGPPRRLVVEAVRVEGPLDAEALDHRDAHRRERLELLLAQLSRRGAQETGVHGAVHAVLLGEPRPHLRVAQRVRQELVEHAVGPLGTGDAALPIQQAIGPLSLGVAAASAVAE